MGLTSHPQGRASVYESSPQECCLPPFPTLLNIARVCYVPALSLLLLLARVVAAVAAAAAATVAAASLFFAALSLRVPYLHSRLNR